MISILFLSTQAKVNTLQETCLSCHQAQQVPSKMIYKRYLMQYSTDRYMEEAMFVYLKNPNKEHSIMPKAFFLKFPMKERMMKDEVDLRKDIEKYLDYFDLKKKLVNK